MSTISTTMPADVVSRVKNLFVENMSAITHNTDNVFLYICDQKITHPNFSYTTITLLDALYPEHLFRIAAYGKLGAMLVPLGLLSRYGARFKNIDYIVQLNGVTDLVPLEQQDPLCAELYTVEDVIDFQKDTGLLIRGVSLTLYVGNVYEAKMLTRAAQTILAAHRQGLVTFLRLFPCGSAIKDDNTPELTAGMAGLAHALGADYVIIKIPYDRGDHIGIAQQLHSAGIAAGNTGVLCADSAVKDIPSLLDGIYLQVRKGSMRGCTVGKNIFQRSLPEALATTHAIFALVYEDADVQSAEEIYQQQLVLLSDLS